MKKINLFLSTIGLSLLSLTSLAQSETFKAIEWDFPLALGYAIPKDGGGGILWFSEARYNLSDEISIGIRPQFAIMAGGDEFTSVSAVGSYSLVGDYYFSNNTVRPFAGLGIGSFGIGTVAFEDENGNEVEVEGGAKLGFSPRIGLELGHFRIAAEYNAILGTDIYNPSYFTIKGALTLFGGKK